VGQESEEINYRRRLVARKTGYIIRSKEDHYQGAAMMSTYSKQNWIQQHD
jgi:hypothetical protein